ncbi:MAG: mechanosensitive ion channel, partial [Chlorobiales bacterium]|nr:mechanosensitive ion channel [Chlorobiales bacterium]
MIMSTVSSLLVIDPVFRLLESFGIAPSLSLLIATVIAATVLLALIAAVQILVKKTLLRIVARLARKTSTRLDDYLVQRHVFSGLAMMVPPILLHNLASPVFKFYPDLIPFIRDGAVLYFAVIVVKVLFSVLDAVHDFLLEHPVGVKLPVKSFVQVFKTIVFGIASIYILSRLLGKSPLVFFSGLGAFTAVLMLIFKDSILGLVAGVQLSSNDLVRP